VFITSELTFLMSIPSLSKNDTSPSLNESGICKFVRSSGVDSQHSCKQSVNRPVAGEVLTLTNCPSYRDLKSSKPLILNMFDSDNFPIK
jgi:hypothetical protein